MWVNRLRLLHRPGSAILRAMNLLMNKMSGMNFLQQCLRLGLVVSLAGLVGPSQPAFAAENLSNTQVMPEPVLKSKAPPAVAKGFQLPPGITVVSDLKYGPNGDANLLDIYRPEKFEGLLPLVVWIHGGGWANGDKSPSPQFLQMIPMGFAVASINYRLSGQAPFPAQIFDCKGAIRWLRAHAKEYQLDPDHIGVWGLSAGGHLVALLGTSGGVKELEGDVGGNLDVSSRVQAVSDYAGPTDMSQFWAQAAPNNAFWPAKGHSYFDLLFGKGPLEDHPDLVRMANPIIYITADDPPFQIFHGEKDTSVPFGQGQILADALKAKGVPCEFTPLPTMGHGFGQGQYRMTFAFFEKHLKPAAKPATAPGAAPVAPGK